MLICGWAYYTRWKAFSITWLYMVALAGDANFTLQGAVLWLTGYEAYITLQGAVRWLTGYDANFTWRRLGESYDAGWRFFGHALSGERTGKDYSFVPGLF